MRHFIGLGMLVIGAALIYAGHSHRSRVLAARAAAEARGEPPPPEPGLRSLAVFGEIVRPFILLFVALLALQLIFGYVVFDGGQYLSYLDLAGLLVAFCAYGYWLTVKTTYRMSDFAAPSSKPPAEPARDSAPPMVAAPVLVPASDAATRD